MKYFSIFILLFAGHAHGDSWRGDYSYISYSLEDGWKKVLSMSQKGDDWIAFRSEKTNATITFGIGPVADYKEDDAKFHALEKLKKEEQPKVLFDVILEPFGESPQRKVDSKLELFGRHWQAVDFEIENEKFGQMDIKVSAAFEEDCSWSIVIAVPKKNKSDELDRSITKILNDISYRCPNKAVNVDSATKTPLKLR